MIMKWLIKSILLLLLHFSTECYTKISLSNYTLTPLAHGYYFSNNPKVNWYTARKNCIHYGLELASVFDQEDYDEIKDAFLTHPMWDTFVGKSSGLYTSALGEQPWKLDKFTWRAQGNDYSMNNFSITQKLWAPGQPDNENPLEQCTVIFMLSDEKPDLVMDDVQCGWLRGFLCQLISLPGAPAPKPITGDESKQINNHTVLGGHKSWAKGVMECAKYNLTQPILSTEKAIAAFMENYVASGIVKENEEIWTSASCLGELDKEDLEKMPTAHKFRWPDHRFYNKIPRCTEQCLAFSQEKGLFEESCLKNLTIVCTKPSPAKCHDLEFEQIKIDTRTFYYSSHSLMSWADALMCCASRQQRLLSVATPIVGNLLANFLQKNKSTVGKHLGFKYGIWTSGNLLTRPGQRNNLTYEFASSYDRIDLEEIGVNHYMAGPKLFDGECLQFIVDEGIIVNTYILNNISCEFYRSFICEAGERLTTIVNTTWLASPKDKSVVYVNSTATWQEAFLACSMANMTLLTIENEEENEKALNLIQKAQGPEEEPWMIWLGGTRLNGISILPQFYWLSVNRSVNYSSWVHGEPDYEYAHEWCMNGFAKDEKFVWDDIDCQQKMHFMCKIPEVLNNIISGPRNTDSPDAVTTTTEPTPPEVEKPIIMLPLAYGYHTSSIMNMSYAEGKDGCQKRSLKVAKIATYEDYLDIQSSLMFSADPFWQLFVGLSNGHFVDVEYNNFTLLEENWSNGLPTSKMMKSECTRVFLDSMLNPTLLLQPTFCSSLHGFLCSSNRITDTITVEQNGAKEKGSSRGFKIPMEIMEPVEYSEENTNDDYKPPTYYVSEVEDTSHWFGCKIKCKQKDMQLLAITSRKEYEAVLARLLENKQDFIGAEHGLYTSAVGAQPWRKYGFSWTIGSELVLMIDYPVTDKLWAPEQPDNAQPVEACALIYLLPIENSFKLAMDDVQCRVRRRYICQPMITH